MLHYLGLVLVLASWAGGAYMITKWRNKDFLTISKHAASTKESAFFFAGILICLGLVFYYWLLAWFAPHLHLHTDFKVVLSITIACQIITALAPDTKGIVRSIHRIAAYTMAILYLPLSWIVLRSPEMSNIARYLGGLLLAYMVVTFICIVLFKLSRKRYLIFQALYVIAFQLIVLFAAYL
jgi:hypothetical protein